MVEPNNFEIPPWKSPEVWSETCWSIEQAISHHWESLDEARHISGKIGEKYDHINDALDSVCKQTCSYCTDICCKKATVWYDLKDLLYIYLHSGQFPDEQIKKTADLSCCNLTSTGCLIARNMRPFICTWYICPSLTAMLSERVLGEPESLILSSIKEIQSLRSHLEDTFIKTVVSRSIPLDGTKKSEPK